MSPEAQRIAILTHLGWTELKRTGRRGEDGPQGALRGTDPMGLENRYAPNPLTNLNAMHEAEKILTHHQRIDYLEELAEAAGSYADATYATAAQRAEAFLRTLNLWKP